jgi:hypothetical protein
MKTWHPVEICAQRAGQLLSIQTVHRACHVRGTPGLDGQRQTAARKRHLHIEVVGFRMISACTRALARAAHMLPATPGQWPRLDVLRLLTARQCFPPLPHPTLSSSPARGPGIAAPPLKA